MNKEVFVIGSNAFSASSFIKYALLAGYSVVGISRSPEPHEAFLPYKWGEKLQQFQFYQLDINHNLSQIMALIDARKPDYVVNYAAQSMVAQSWDHPDHWYMTNVVSTIRFIEQLRHCSFIKKYVHISTPEVYGNCEGLVVENHHYHPSTPYAISRAAADMHLKACFDMYQFPVVFTRAANVYGAGQQLYRIIPRTVLFIKLGKKLQLHGGGISERSFIHIDDVSAATLRIMCSEKVGEIYHISTQRIVSIRALVQLVCNRMSVLFEDYVEDSDERPGKDAAYLLSSAKLRKRFDWNDQIGLEQGVDAVIQWVDHWYDQLNHQPIDYIHKA